LQLGLGHPWVEAWLKKQIGKGCRGLHNPNSIKKKGKKKEEASSQQSVSATTLSLH
jgi:hypothetical protein